MIVYLVLIGLAGLIAGLWVGLVLAGRSIPKALARLSEAELRKVGDAVRRERRRRAA